MIILIQGAMDEEIHQLIKRFKAKKEKIQGYQFYFGNYLKHKIIISLTKIGTVNASKATRIAINKFKPTHVINIGLCGAQIKTLHPFDIVIGDKVIYISHRTKHLILKGSRSLSLLTNKVSTKIKIYHSLMGSANLFTKDKKEIIKYHKNCHHVTEDMESIASYFECDEENIKHLTIRIVSNNELLDEDYEKYHKKASRLLQDFIYKFINVLIKACN